MWKLRHEESNNQPKVTKQLATELGLSFALDKYSVIASLLKSVNHSTKEGYNLGAIVIIFILGGRRCKLHSRGRVQGSFPGTESS